MFAGISGENRHNDLLVSLLATRMTLLNWTVPDQPRGGLSGEGKEAGARDWVIRYAGGELAIFEALELKSVVKRSIDEHVDKAVFKYDGPGLPQTYIVVYYKGDSPWDEFWQRYLGHVKVAPIRDMRPIGPPEILAAPHSGTRPADPVS